MAACAGRTLAEDVVAARDLPAADVSAMDGWAVRAADTPGTLLAAGESAAGAPRGAALRPGEAVLISTGAVLPPGADAVARREVVSADGDAVSAVAPGRDVRRTGEVIRTGGVLLAAGHRVRAHEVGAIGAVAGRATVRCARRPRAGVLATGSELVPLGAPVGPAEVHDSSRLGVAAQLAAAGADVVAEGVVADGLEETVEALAAMLDAGADVLVTCGGISAGDHDLVRPALARLGFEEVVRGVRAMPIRPTVIARRGAHTALGLPGNPASAAIAAHVLGRPLLGVPDGPWARAPLAGDVAGHPDRPLLLRCALAPEGLVPRPHQGAHAVTSLAGADALAVVPAGGARAGDAVAWSPLP